jgi:hypothetical protein
MKGGKKRIERGILFQSRDFQGRVRAFLIQSEKSALGSFFFSLVRSGTPLQQCLNFM